MIFSKIYTWSYSAGVQQFVSITSRYLEIQNIQKSCIHNHDKNDQFEDLYLVL